MVYLILFYLILYIYKNDEENNKKACTVQTWDKKQMQSLSPFHRDESFFSQDHGKQQNKKQKKCI